jgi:primosomal replication protein N
MAEYSAIRMLPAVLRRSRRRQPVKNISRILSIIQSIGDSSERPIQVNIQLIDQTTGNQHNITGTEAFQQGDVVTVTGFLNDVDTGGPMSTAIADAHGLRRQARGAF